MKQTDPQLIQRCVDLIVELGLGAVDDVVKITPLTGGVASDIVMVDLGDQKICIKFALAKLKVAEDWFAPVHRNKAEYLWLATAASIAPDTALKLFGRSDRLNGFAMEYVHGDDVYLWKDALLQGHRDKGEAAQVGEVLGHTHASSAATNFDTKPFQNRDDFQALRLEPYLRFTATHHPQLAGRLNNMAEMLFFSNQVLIHGDVSPKNILFRANQPIFLDAECVTMGDASFDVAFCLNHLVLKAVHLPQSRSFLLRSVGAFWSAYAKNVDWENINALEVRICALLPMLMLARVDGKSPVEYLSQVNRQRVRDIAIPMVKSPPGRLRDFVQILASNLEGTKS